jgi:predicted DCC family thiol-disulfide oxidoreductase YuxK
MKNFCLQNSVISEATEPRDETGTQGWIFYDADCRFCSRSARRFAGTFHRRGFEFLPLQISWVTREPGIERGAALEEMRVLTRKGKNYGGAEALAFLARRVWWAWPFFLMAQLPGAHRLIDSGYRWIAAHRGCERRACQNRRKWPAWLGLLSLPTFAYLNRNQVPPWVFMWLMVAAIFFGCKWLTFWTARDRIVISSVGGLAWFFAWPGMNAAKFFRPPCRREVPGLETIIFAFAKILFGALFLFVAARHAGNLILAGWIGMLGLILILHFGLFHLAAIGWRIAGVNVDPVMTIPWRAKSLSEFWGRRWNGAFNQLALDHVFRPLARSVGIVSATLSAFFVSGLIHESVISLPAKAGYGLPTVYFLLQGCGVVAERALPKIRGRILTIVVVAAPAFWLFHPPFVRAVIIPFMKAIGAL